MNNDLKDLYDQFNTLISEKGFDRLREKLLTIARPTIQLVSTISESPSPCSSRFGGLPEVPDQFVWPTFADEPLSFIAQINCSEIAPFDFENLLPKSGMLYFFYDTTEKHWDHYHDCSRVIYTTETNLHKISAPPSFSEERVLPSLAITFNLFLSLPEFHSLVYKIKHSLPWDEQDDDDVFYNYIQINSTLRGEPYEAPDHQMLGFPTRVQMDEMELECEKIRRGLAEIPWTAPLAEELAHAGKEWRLLFQVDSDENLNLIWGDLGLVHFWIHRSDLQQLRFEKVITFVEFS